MEASQEGLNSVELFRQSVRQAGRQAVSQLVVSPFSKLGTNLNHKYGDIFYSSKNCIKLKPRETSILSIQQTNQRANATKHFVFALKLS
jgi:hypothetical protein